MKTSKREEVRLVTIQRMASTESSSTNLAAVRPKKRTRTLEDEAEEFKEVGFCKLIFVGKCEDCHEMGVIVRRKGAGSSLGPYELIVGDGLYCEVMGGYFCSDDMDDHEENCRACAVGPVCVGKCETFKKCKKCPPSTEASEVDSTSQSELLVSSTRFEKAFLFLEDSNL